jgi:hypothetical protein
MAGTGCRPRKKEILNLTRQLATMLISVRCAALAARFTCAWLAMTVLASGQ